MIDEPYLLDCYRYIELNPVTAAMVDNPEKYPWSSYDHNGLGKLDPLITEHSLYQQLGASRSEKTDYYRVLIQNTLGMKIVGEIGQCFSANRVLGRESFRQQVQTELGRRFNSGRQGRPIAQN